MVQPSVQAQEGVDQDFNVLDALVVLAKHKGIVLGLAAAVAIVAGFVTLLVPSVYTATTKILPPQPSLSTSSLIASQFVGLTGGMPAAIPGLKNPSDLYVGMLKSRTVADNLIRRFQLLNRYDVRYLEQARLKLDRITSMNTGRDSIITIQVDDTNPQFAADLANAYVEELYKLTKVLAVTEMSQRRLFFERQFAQAKEDLLKAEASAKDALAKGGVLKVDEQGRTLVETAARLRAQITVKEVQIGAMRTFATDENPQLVLAQQELATLKRELAKAEGLSVPKLIVDKSDATGTQNLALLRELKYNEALYEMLAKQVELAKIDEAKEASLIQVLDAAVAPERRSKPKRIPIVLIAATIGLLAGILYAFAYEQIAKAKDDPAQSKRLETIKRSFGWR